MPTSIRGCGAYAARWVILGAAAAAGGGTTGVYGNLWGTRESQIWIPSGCQAGQPVPLVLMIHGCLTYLNAKAVSEGLRLADRDPTRQRFIDALESMSRFDLGGFELSYGKGRRGGSRHVDLTCVTSGELFIR